MAVGRRPGPLERARRLGADLTLSTEDDDVPAAVADLGGLDVLFEATGQAPLVARAQRWVRPGGSAVVYGAPEDEVALDLMVAPFDVPLIRPRTRETAVLTQVVRLVGTGFVDTAALKVRPFPFERALEAFAAVDAGEVGKALLVF